MRKIILVLAVASLVACNNTSSGTTAEGKTRSDSLLDDVMDGHNVGMGKMGKLTTAEQQATRILDSIAKLPAKAKEAAAPYKAKLNDLLTDLHQADSSMNKWMSEFTMDSAISNAEERIKYLVSEKEKVTVVKQAILNSLQKADTVLKRNFK